MDSPRHNRRRLLKAKLHHIHLKGPDPRRTARWYVDNLGAKILDESDRNGILFLRVDLGGTLMNVTGPKPGTSPGPGDSSLHYGLEHFGVEVDDLVSLIASLKKQGVNVLKDTAVSPSGKTAFVEGPDSTRIELMEIHPGHSSDSY